MDPDGWAPVLQNMLLGPKPGATIQWTEPAISRTQVLRGKDDSMTAALKSFSHMFRSPMMKRRFENGWSTLPNLVEQAGLTVEVGVVSCDRVAENRSALAENEFVALMAAARKMAEGGISGALEVSKINELEEIARGDIESGAYPQHSLHTAIGFKT